ncbi:MAG TPA: acyltransferase [Verrucomicrobiae bacterium]
MPKPWNVARLQRITTSSHRYIAEVDGLRFIAIFSVLLFHVHYAATNIPGKMLAASPFNFLFWPVTNGYRGVELFFVISGFILGLPFAAHYLADAPAVKIGKFYLRRLTRLEPPYVLALLLFYAAAVGLHDIHAQDPNFFSGLLLRLGYAHSIVRGLPPKLDGVTWTLEVEVQFYLLVPLLAKIFKLAAAPRRLILIAAIFTAPLLANFVPRSELTLPGFIQYFLTGFLLADLHSTGAGAGKISARSYDWLAMGALLALALTPDTIVLWQLFPWLLAMLFIGALRGNWFTTILRRPVIATLGGMCYSLYLLHYPLFSFIATKIISSGVTMPIACLRLGLVGLPVVVGAGIAYYILIERPCMNPNWPQLVWQNVRRMGGSIFKQK